MSVSVLIAARHAQDFIADAVESVILCAGAMDVEIVIASDDGTDYAAILPKESWLSFTEVGPAHTGAHAARNRALALARGEFFTILDADDCYTGQAGSLQNAVALARDTGISVIPTRILNPLGETIRRVPDETETEITLTRWQTVFSSLHTVVRRDKAAEFLPFRLIDDVIFDLGAMARCGGTAPVARRITYDYHIRSGQMTDTPFANFDLEYSRIMDLMKRDETLFGHNNPAVRDVFRKWRAMNRLAGRSLGSPKLGGYHSFVKDSLTCARARSAQ